MVRNGRPTGLDSQPGPIDPSETTDHVARLVSHAVQSALWAEMSALASTIGRVAEDIVRFVPVAEACRQTRERRGLDIKSVAKQLKKPQYAVADLEDCRLDRLDHRLVARYVSFLGLDDWFERWRSENQELHDRLANPALRIPPAIDVEMLSSLLDNREPGSSPMPTGSGVALDRDVVFQIKVTLEDSRPPIWRRILVSGHVTLHQLHQVVQRAMGWHDAHLYEFQHAGFRYSDPSLHDEAPDSDELDARKHRLGELALTVGTALRYRYDFGDGWDHRLEIEKVVAGAGALATPTCIGGARACPPENCGGIHGYADLLKPRRGKSQLDDEGAEALSEGFNPERFEVTEADRALARFRRKNRAKS